MEFSDTNVTSGLRFRVFVVTYRNNGVLNGYALRSLIASDIFRFDSQIFVINNHTELEIASEYRGHVTVLNNTLRPDFSTGHLSRNWNQALIHGFKDLHRPAADIVTCMQNDAVVVPDCFSILAELHRSYDFITAGIGDCVHSYTPNAVKRIGLWDERFCGIGYQEADYFLRALLFHRQKSSINDHGHGRASNPSPFHIVDERYARDTGSARRDESHLLSARFHSLSHRVFQEKWSITPEWWTAPGGVMENLDKLRPRMPSFIYYPYFEVGIDADTLDLQSYLRA